MLCRGLAAGPRAGHVGPSPSQSLLREQPPTIRFAYHRPGKGTSSYAERLVLDRSDLKVLWVDHYDGPEVRVRSRPVLEPGAVATWFVIPGAWYDVGRFHLRDGRFTGWYTNLCTPIRFGAEWSATDLFLDHWLSADGWGAWLDEDELAAAIEDRLLTAEAIEHLQVTRDSVAGRVQAGAWPPESVLRAWEEVSGRLPRPVSG